MFAAVRQALEELRVRSGQKRLILFTDGRNTVPKPGDNLASLTAALQQADVEVFTIGLRAADLDVGTLSELATNTGGRFFDAARPEELRSAFSTARQQLRRAIYRLVVTPNVPTDVAQLPVEVKIGCANAVVLRKTMPLSKVNRSATYDSTAPGRPPRHTNISHDTDN